MTTGDNLMLYVAAYDDATAAADDFVLLQDADAVDELRIVGAVVLDRDHDGEVDVKAHHTGLVGGGAGAGGVVGLVVGLFAPPLLLSTAAGAAIGAGIGALMKRHEESQLEIALHDYLPPGSSAIVALVEDRHLDRIDEALTRSAKKVSRAIDSGDYDKIRQELEDAGYRIGRAIES
ncbi:MAG TPA: DUF1269 domain-containing protein [Euzebyales bacterium]